MAVFSVVSLPDSSSIAQCTVLMFGQTSMTVSFAPILYADSASPLAGIAQLARSTAYSVGTKLYFNGVHFLECMIAGTTAASQPTYPTTSNTSVTDGTAVFRTRRYQGWARAWAFGANSPYSATLQGGDHSILLSSNTTFTQLAASYSNFVFTVYSGASANSGVGVHASVSKTNDRVSAYSAGAKVVQHVNADSLASGSGWIGHFVRGITFEKPGGNGNGAAYDVVSGFGAGTYYDCTFRSSARSTATASFMPPYSGVRCTFNQFAANAANLFGTPLSSALSFSLVAPTVTMSTLPGSLGSYFVCKLGASWSPGCDEAVAAGNFSGLTNMSAWSASTQSSMATWALTFVGSRFVAGATDLTTYNAWMMACNAGTPNDWRVPPGNTGLSPQSATGRTLDYAVYRTGGAAGAQGNFSLRNDMDYQRRRHVVIEFFNTRISEGFTITVEVLAALSGTGLTDLSEKDIWLDCVYPAETNTWRGGYASTFNPDNPAGLIHNGAVPTMLTPGSAWTGAPAGSVARKLTVTVNPRRVGMIRLRVNSALCPYSANLSVASTLFTLYVDPTVTIGNAP